jgi:amino acid transporter
VLLSLLLKPQAWLFFGYEAAGIVSEEVKDAKKSVPRAMTLSLVLAAAIVFFLQCAFVISIPNINAATANTNAAIPLILEAHIGNIATRILSFFLCLAYLSRGSAIQATCARIIFAYARDKMMPFPHIFSRVSEGTKVPVNATLSAIVIPFLVMTTTFATILNVDVISTLATYAVRGVNIAFQMCVAARLYSHKGFSRYLLSL